MRHRVLSFVLVAVTLLALTGSVFAQGTRVDQIVGFAQTPGVPAVASGTFQPTVMATDLPTQQMAAVLSPYVTDMDAWFAMNFGWRSSKPVTFVLFSNGQNEINALQSMVGPGQVVNTNLVLSRPSFPLLIGNSAFGIPIGEWAILVNTSLDTATQQAGQLNSLFYTENGVFPIPMSSILESQDEGMRLMQESMAADYAGLMEVDTAGNAGPTWYRLGLANTIAFQIVPGTPMQGGQPMTVATYQHVNNTLPPLTDLEQNWNGIIGLGGQIVDVAHGIAYLSTSFVVGQAGGMNALDVLKSTASGQDFNTALQSITGFSLPMLNLQYQSLIP